MLNKICLNQPQLTTNENKRHIHYDYRLVLLVHGKKIQQHLFYVTGNATRQCYEDGIWQDRSDYTGCRPIDKIIDLVSISFKPVFENEIGLLAF